MNYYIYYRVALTGEAFKTRARAMQSDLQRETGIDGQLLKGEGVTWMEIYEAVSDIPKFEGAIERLVAAHRLDEALEPDGRRFTERFEPV